MTNSTAELYAKALREGQKYYKAMTARGADPCPPVLDELLRPGESAGTVGLGVINVPAELITGTKTPGRVSALAGNFMPLLEPDTEFAAKWMRLAEAQLEGEGIREPVQCFEYLGRFYVQEGNKRVSVLKALGAASIVCNVTRVLPGKDAGAAAELYGEFLDFYGLSGLYGIEFTRAGSYARLQAALGFEPDHVWTDSERLAFSAGFQKFREAYESIKAGLASGADTASAALPSSPTAAEALLIWLELYPFSAIKEKTPAELLKTLQKIKEDVESKDGSAIEIRTAPSEKDKSLISKVINIAVPDHINIAFIYAFPPRQSAWTHAHMLGSRHLEQTLGSAVSVRGYEAFDHDFEAAMKQAAADGAQLIFATTPGMMSACRKFAAEHENIKILDCSLAQPYKSVRSYYCRIHECKFITGAVAGAMCGSGTIGYVSNYPIYGVPAQINAFALGARMTAPDARIKLDWGCTPGDPIKELTDAGVRVISNRDAADRQNLHRALDWGLYRLSDEGSLTTLALPRWNWGIVYEKIVRGIFSGAWKDTPHDSAVNYWWGMDSGALDVELSKSLPDGVCSLAWILKNGLRDGSVQPFRTRVSDQSGVLRNDGLRDLTPEELLEMDWLADNVDGRIPGFSEISPASQQTVRMMGLHRESIPPEPIK
jgi:basic membrane lipoprotein Med (substrate-binding protein (PBP1-ABC) superfamily)